MRLVPVEMNAKLRQDLDEVLLRLTTSYYEGNVYAGYSAIYNEYKKAGDSVRLRVLLDILETDGYVRVEIAADMMGRWYTPTAEGNRFILLEGYVKQSKKALEARIWSVAKICVSVLHGLLLLYLTYRSIGS